MAVRQSTRPTLPAVRRSAASASARSPMSARLRHASGSLVPTTSKRTYRGHERPTRPRRDRGDQELGRQRPAQEARRADGRARARARRDRSCRSAGAGGRDRRRDGRRHARPLIDDGERRLPRLSAASSRSAAARGPPCRSPRSASPSRAQPRLDGLGARLDGRRRRGPGSTFGGERREELGRRERRAVDRRGLRAEPRGGEHDGGDGADREPDRRGPWRRRVIARRDPRAASA